MIWEHSFYRHRFAKMKVFRLNSVIKRIQFTVAFYSDRLMPLKPSAAIASAISIAFFSLV